MAFGAVFTTSDIGGGRAFTRIKGQLLLGQPSGEPGGQSLDPSPAFGGSAAQPLLSFFNRPDTGFWVNNLTTSAAELRLAVIAADVVQFTSQGIAIVGLSTGSQPVYATTTSGVTGLYSSAATVLGFAVNAKSISLLSTVGFSLLTTATGGFASTGGTLPTMFIMQTTAASAGGTVGPALNSGAALQWDSATKTLEVFSTVTGAWMRIHSSSNTALTYSSS